MTDLPEGWTRARLPEVADLIMGQSPPSSTYNASEVGLPFFQGKAEFGDIYPTPVKYCSAPQKIAEKADILISVRAPVGPTNICNEKSCIGRGLAAIRPRAGVIGYYVFYFLRSIEQWLASQGTGSTFTAISKSDLERIEVPLPPPNEQRRILAMLEESLGKVDACQKRLARIPVILKRFRQSVLVAAYSGRLTADLRETQDDSQSVGHPLESLQDRRKQVWQSNQTFEPKRSYHEAIRFDVNNLPTIPNTWEWTSADAVCSQITDGEHIQPAYHSEGSPLLTAKHVRDGYVTFDNAGYIKETDFRKALERCAPANGDILIVSVGATTGRAAIVADCPPFAIVRSVLLLKPLIDSQYLLRWIQSPCCFSWMTQASGASAQPHLYIKDTKRMPVPIAPLAEQQEITRRVEALLKLADQIEARYEKGRAQVDKLTQSILAKAFRGELVPIEAELARREGRDYESASAGLEGIRKNAASRQSTR